MADPRSRDAHARLSRLLAQDRIALGVNVGLMSRPGSPVSRRVETALPIALGLSGAIGATIAGGAALGGVALAAGLALWFLVVLPRVRERVYARTCAYVASTPEAFLEAWQAQAITLRVGEAECRPPADDWAAFVQAARTRDEEEEEGIQ